MQPMFFGPIPLAASRKLATSALPDAPVVHAREPRRESRRSERLRRRIALPLRGLREAV
jgi:hypothetical protein